MVDAISLYLDYIVGCNNAASQKDAEKAQVFCLSHGMLHSRICVWNVVCTRASPYVRIEFQADGGLDNSGTSV